MDSWYLMTGLFCCIPLMTAKYSALPPRIPCPVAVTRARDTASVPWPYPVLDILRAGIRSFQLLLRGIKHCCLSRRVWKWFRQDLNILCPRGYLSSWVALIKHFWVWVGLEDTYYLSVFWPLPPPVMTVLTCVCTGEAQWSGRNQSEPWNTMITYFIPS